MVRKNDRIDHNILVCKELIFYIQLIVTTIYILHFVHDHSQLSVLKKIVQDFK